MINVTIDPGLGGTGYAVWAAAETEWKDPNVPPLFADVLETAGTSTGANWLERVDEMSIYMRMVIPVWTQTFGAVDKFWIEHPMLMTTAKGFASAERGDVFKLTLLVGAFYRVCWDLKINPIPLGVNEWKSTLPKDVITRWLRDRYKISYPNHAGDAVGMGLFLKGGLNASGTLRPKEHTDAVHRTVRSS